MAALRLVALHQVLALELLPFRLREVLITVMTVAAVAVLQKPVTAQDLFIPACLICQQEYMKLQENVIQ